MQSSRQDSIAGQTHGSVYNKAQCSDVPDRRADRVEWPFPSKPVSHRRPLNPKTQKSLDLYKFENIDTSKQTRGPLLPQEHNSYGVREIPGSHHPRKDSLKLYSEEKLMARAIHAKEVMLQEKLWRVEEKVREKLHMRSVGTAAYDDQKSEEASHNRGQAEKRKSHTKTRMTEQHRREPVKSREDLMQERIQDDVKQLWKKQSQRDEVRMRNTHEEEMGSWGKGEIELAEGNKGTRDITVNKQKVNGELNKLRWQSEEKHTKIQEDGKYNCTGGRAGTQDGIEKAKGRKLSKASTENIGWRRENKYLEKTFKGMYRSDNEPDVSQMSQRKTAPRLATEDHRGAEGKIEESILPPLADSSFSSRPLQGELGLMDSTVVGLHLLPCSICNRKFASGRLEKHVQICKKVTHSHRKVFNSYINRTKGSAIEEFWNTHSRSKTPEILQKNNQRPNHKAHPMNLQQGRLPAATFK